MKHSDQTERQWRFYETREHDHLRPREDDYYARKLAGRVCDHAGIGPEDRVLEIGAGFGRFSFHLLERCESLLALDLSPTALEHLERTRDERGIPKHACETCCLDVARLDDAALGERFDFIVGLFLLHHLADFPSAIGGLAKLLNPGGCITFLEPNRRNPLFLAQLAFAPDMPWREEKGLFLLSGKGVEAAYRRAALKDIRTATFGFFPPQVLNRFSAARSAEARLERMRVLRWLLPFLLLGARAPQPSDLTDSSEVAP